MTLVDGVLAKVSKLLKTKARKKKRKVIKFVFMVFVF